jgi:hypothetical protein
MYRKNTTGQYIYFCLVNATTGAALTGATVTAYRALDNGSQAAATGTTTELANGQYRFTLSQADTNGDYGSYLFTATNAVPVEKTVVFTQANPQDAAGFGLSRLDQTIGSRMATYTQPTGFLASTFPATVSSYAGGAVASVTAGVTVATNNDKTGYTVSTVSDKTGYSLTAGTGLGNQTSNITGNLSGSVGSVTGAVGSVTGAVGSVTGNVGGNVTGSVGSISGVTFPSGFNALTVAAIADGVWDEATSGHTTAGTTGAAIIAAGSAGDPWSTSLPGAYGAGTAGKIIGDNINATISSRMASYTQPTGFLAATFPATVSSYAGGAVASVTAGVTLDSSERNTLVDLVWDEAMSGHTTAGTYGGRIVRATNSNTEVQITGSNHIAADVHEFQTAVITAEDFAANAITASALATDAVTEIQSGLATGAALAAAKTILDKVDTGLVVDGAVYQFTANMLELGPAGGGGSTVNVLPATGIVADRSAGTTLTPVVGETISQSITVYQSDGTTAVSLSGKTLRVIFETMSGVDVAVVPAADITISGTNSNVVTFAYPSAVTASERTLRFAIRDAAAPLTMYLQGVCSVVAAPKVDS